MPSDSDMSQVKSSVQSLERSMGYDLSLEGNCDDVTKTLDPVELNQRENV